MDKGRYDQIGCSVRAPDMRYIGVAATDEEARKFATELNASKLPPPGHVLLPDGRCVKVLGTLPMTADGCVVGIDDSDEPNLCERCNQDAPRGVLWHPEYLDRPAELHGDFVFVGCTDAKHKAFYSTRAAATAAQAASGEGKAKSRWMTLRRDGECAIAARMAEGREGEGDGNGR